MDFINDKTLDELDLVILETQTRHLDTTFSIEEMSKVIETLRAERTYRRELENALELITNPTKLGEHGDPWFYRQSTAKEALKKKPEGLE